MNIMTFMYDTVCDKDTNIYYCFITDDNGY